MAEHVRAMLELQARRARSSSTTATTSAPRRRRPASRTPSTSPASCPPYIRPLFCEGKGPFRWAALSGDPDGHRARPTTPCSRRSRTTRRSRRWIRLARERVQFQGLPARICWLGYGERAQAGPASSTSWCARASVKAPIVIGRDHLDAGSVASPNRETEAMRDGSDAVADWPILNALLNTVAGATWVSVHHGGGVGIGYSMHAGMVVVADGTPRPRPRGSSACSPPTPAPASCATPTPATSARSTWRASAGSSCRCARLRLAVRRPRQSAGCGPQPASGSGREHRRERVPTAALDQLLLHSRGSRACAQRSDAARPTAPPVSQRDGRQLPGFASTAAGCRWDTRTTSRTFWRERRRCSPPRAGRAVEPDLGGEAARSDDDLACLKVQS